MTDNTNWYENGIDLICQEISESSDVDLHKVQLVYSYLCEVGLIDYDIEKDILWTRYFEPEDE